jgi:hypothetical protein
VLLQDNMIGPIMHDEEVFATDKFTCVGQVRAITDAVSYDHSTAKMSSSCILSVQDKCEKDSMHKFETSAAGKSVSLYGWIVGACGGPTACGSHSGASHRIEVQLA